MITFNQFLEMMHSPQWQQFFNHVIQQYKAIEQATANIAQYPQQIEHLAQQAKDAANKLFDSSVNAPKDIENLKNKWGYFDETQLHAIATRTSHAAHMLQDLLKNLPNNNRLTQELQQLINKLHAEANKWSNLSSQMGQNH